MRPINHKKSFMRYTASLMLTLFVLWSSLFSLHLIFSPAHSHHRSLENVCHCCHHESFDSDTDDSRQFRSHDDEGENSSCPFCLFASELNTAGTSTVFFLCRYLNRITVEVDENFNIVCSILATNFARGPPDNIA